MDPYPDPGGPKAYGSGSFYHPTVLCLLCDFLSLKNDAYVPCFQNVISRKLRKKIVFCWCFEGQQRKSRIRSRIRMRTKMSCMSCTVVPYQNSLSVQVVWAVTDLGSVPKGSVLINPDTGTPYLNRKPDHTANLYWP